MTHSTESHDAVRDTVREAYAEIAGGRRDSCCSSRKSCCDGSASDALAKEMGYSEAELADLPEGANMGLSCGNPTAIASLSPGEVVLDLGSGGGFDVFIAARKVGPDGLSIGVDMTPDMVSKARRNAATFAGQTGLHNTDFRLGEIEHLPVADNSVDVIISNCVINLSPDKPQVWREMFRALKPGGRVAVSDMALLMPLPPEVKACVEALTGCIAGAVQIEETRALAEAAGFTDIRCDPKTDAVDTMDKWNDPLYEKVRAALPAGTKMGDYVTSLYVAARKPCCARGEVE